jgi:hypothetical protein
MMANEDGVNRKESGMLTRCLQCPLLKKESGSGEALLTLGTILKLSIAKIDGQFQIPAPTGPSAPFVEENCTIGPDMVE